MSSNNIVFNKEAKEYVPKKKKQEEEKTTMNSNSEIQSSNIVQKIKKDEINEKEVKNIQFNLNAKEYIPKKESDNNGYKIEGLEDDAEEEESEDDIIDELVNQELNDPIDPYAVDEDESDDEKWFPKYKDCSCCEGYIYKCSGDVCTSLGVCFCKAQEDYDPEAN
jgi:hypothetical protein